MNLWLNSRVCAATGTSNLARVAPLYNPLFQNGEVVAQRMAEAVPAVGDVHLVAEPPQRRG
jgi:hypothetical protein